MGLCETSSHGGSHHGEKSSKVGSIARPPPPRLCWSPSRAGVGVCVIFSDEEGFLCQKVPPAHLRHCRVTSRAVVRLVMVQDGSTCLSAMLTVSGRPCMPSSSAPACENQQRQAAMAPALHDSNACLPVMEQGWDGQKTCPLLTYIILLLFLQ